MQEAAACLMRKECFVEIGCEDSFLQEFQAGFIQERGGICELGYKGNPTVLLDGFKQGTALPAESQNTGIGEKAGGSADSKKKMEEPPLDSGIGQFPGFQQRNKLRKALVGVAAVQDPLGQFGRKIKILTDTFAVFAE